MIWKFTSGARDHAVTWSMAVFALAFVAASAPLSAKSAGDAPTIAVEQLPAEAQKTLKLVISSGPFPYSRDGVTFGNYEKLLPMRTRGYYHEYTVPTPGLKTRGARRIICGGAKSSISDCYYSDDHYQSFRKIV